MFVTQQDSAGICLIQCSQPQRLSSVNSRVLAAGVARVCEVKSAVLGEGSSHLKCNPFFNLISSFLCQLCLPAIPKPPEHSSPSPSTPSNSAPDLMKTTNPVLFVPPSPKHKSSDRSLSNAAEFSHSLSPQRLTLAPPSFCIRSRAWHSPACLSPRFPCCIVLSALRHPSATLDLGPCSC